MAAIVRFVDAVGSTTTRLDISPGGPNALQLGEGVDFGRPKLSADTADAAAGDGDPYVASRYGNRQISLPLVLPRQASMAARQSAFGALARELDRPSNVLMVQPDGAATPRWLVTYRATDTAAWLRLGAIYTAGTATATMEAQPFAYGPLTAVIIGAVSGNPETGTWIYTLPACAGDVDAPLNLDVFNPGGAPPAQQFVLSCRALRYSAAGTTYLQAATSNAWANVASGVTATGAAGTVSRWTPTVNGVESVLFDGYAVYHPAGPSQDIVGRWRVFARVKRNTAGDVFRLRGTRSQFGGGVLLAPAPLIFGAPTGAGWAYVDLGLIEIPGTGGGYILDPFGDVPSSTPPVAIRGMRVSGSGTLDIDHMLAVPADGRFLGVALNAASVTTTAAAVHIDGDRNRIGIVQSYSPPSGATSDAEQPPIGWTGGMLRLSPRYPTQLFGIADATDTGSTSSTLNLVGSYRPRYLDAL